MLVQQEAYEKVHNPELDANVINPIAMLAENNISKRSQRCSDNYTKKKKKKTAHKVNVKI